MRREGARDPVRPLPPEGGPGWLGTGGADPSQRSHVFLLNFYEGKEN